MGIEALQISHSALKQQVEQLRGELVRRGAQLTELAAELGARSVHVAALRHEVSVKDKLLGHLHEEALGHAEGGDEEVECLMELALSPLAAILTREQTAAAAATGERTWLPRR